MESGDNGDESRCESNGSFSNNNFDAKARLSSQLVGSKIRVP